MGRHTQGPSKKKKEALLSEASPGKPTATEAESEENNKKAGQEEKEAESVKLLVTCEPEQLTQDSPSAEEEEQKSMGNIFSSTSPAGTPTEPSVLDKVLDENVPIARQPTTPQHDREIETEVLDVSDQESVTTSPAKAV